MSGTVRATLRHVFSRVVSIYFRDIEVVGAVPDASTSGRLFGANHVNALVDPILVLTQVPCDVSPIAKSTLWKIPGLARLLDAVSAVPIVRRRDVPNKSGADNDAAFSRVATHLATGGNILIFPEGTSHNEPHLLSLRSGAGRMLATARREAASLPEPSRRPLTFQAVALEFDARDVFRSRALVLFGPARRVDDIGAAATIPFDDDAITSEITATLERDLSELLVEGATWDERLLIARVAEMFADDDTSLSHLNELGRRIEDARRLLAGAEPEVVSAIEGRLRDYFARLDAEEMSDRHVARLARDLARDGDTGTELDADLIRRGSRAAALLVTMPLAVLAAVAYWVPYQLPRLVARRLEADPDVASTYKLGVGLVAFPAWTLLLSALAVWKLDSTLAVFAVGLVLIGPFAALPWLDRWDRIDARLGLLVPTEERRARFAELVATRTALMNDLETTRDRVEKDNST